MNRRAFLSGLIGAVAGAALDPERLLWTPTKAIFIPKASEGISLRLIRQYDLQSGLWVSHDVFSLAPIWLPVPPSEQLTALFSEA